MKSKSTSIIQVGIIVKDVEETAKKLEESIGIGPFEIIAPEYRDLTFRGKPGRFKMKLGLANSGSIQIELMQVLYGETIFDEFIQRKGYGLHHLGIRVGNMNDAMKKMERKGFKVIQSGNRPVVKWAYLDTEDQIGIIFELLEKHTETSR